MACKLWKNILSDKTRNRMAEVLLTGLGFKSGYSDCKKMRLMLVEVKKLQENSLKLRTLNNNKHNKDIQYL